MKDLITAVEAASILGCTRANIERLQFTGKLHPVSTVHPKYYFRKSDVLKLKEVRTSKTDKS